MTHETARRLLFRSYTRKGSDLQSDLAIWVIANMGEMIINNKNL